MGQYKRFYMTIVIVLHIVLHSEMTSRKWTIQLKLFRLKFAEKIRTLLFLSVHITNLVPMRKKSNVGWKSLIV